MMRLLRSVWRGFVDRFTRVSGRSLRPTTAGKWVLFLAVATGFAAMNTGNNLLFFGWGLVLSSIVISGILSESTLQAAWPVVLPPDELRARRDDTLPVTLENHRRVPAFGVEVSLALRARGLDPEVIERTGAAFELRLSPGTARTARVPFRARRRGVFEIHSVRVATAAPFGFFSKERIIDGARVPAGLRSLVVLPERVDTRALAQALWARLGETPAGRVGAGDELFSLRPYRVGDDPRRIAWKRSARTGRVVVREHEATRSREILVDLRVGAGATSDDVEDAVATAGSLAEDLLEDGHAVGVRAHGLLVPPARSARQREACLRGLATLHVKPGLPEAYSGAVVVAVVVGDADREGADVVVEPRPRRSAS